MEAVWKLRTILFTQCLKIWNFQWNMRSKSGRIYGSFRDTYKKSQLELRHSILAQSKSRSTRYLVHKYIYAYICIYVHMYVSLLLRGGWPFLPLSKGNDCWPCLPFAGRARWSNHSWARKQQGQCWQDIFRACAWGWMQVTAQLLKGSAQL